MLRPSFLRSHGIPMHAAVQAILAARTGDIILSSHKVGLGESGNGQWNGRAGWLARAPSEGGGQPAIPKIKAPPGSPPLFGGTRATGPELHSSGAGDRGGRLGASARLRHQPRHTGSGIGIATSQETPRALRGGAPRR